MSHRASAGTSPDGLQHICREIKIEVVMEPVRIESVVGEATGEEANHFQMTARIPEKAWLYCMYSEICVHFSLRLRLDIYNQNNEMNFELKKPTENKSALLKMCNALWLERFTMNAVAYFAQESNI